MIRGLIKAFLVYKAFGFLRSKVRQHHAHH